MLLVFIQMGGVAQVRSPGLFLQPFTYSHSSSEKFALMAAIHVWPTYLWFPYLPLSLSSSPPPWLHVCSKSSVLSVISKAIPDITAQLRRIQVVTRMWNILTSLSRCLCTKKVWRGKWTLIAAIDTHMLIKNLQCHHSYHHEFESCHQILREYRRHSIYLRQWGWYASRESRVGTVSSTSAHIWI